MTKKEGEITSIRELCSISAVICFIVAALGILLGIFDESFVMYFLGCSTGLALSGMRFTSECVDWQTFVDFFDIIAVLITVFMLAMAR